MKSIPAIILTFLILFSCSKVPKPDFTYFPEDNPESGDTIRFKNYSRNADSYEWDFGDGGTSLDVSPDYIYELAGVYEVTLNAFSEAGSNMITKGITIFEPTVLGFIVYDSSLTRMLTGAEIRVYDNKTDRDSLTSPLFSGVTGAEGKLVFNNLEPIIYHIWVSKEVPGGFWIFKGFTNPLIQNKVNNYTVKCIWSEDQEWFTW